MAITNDFFTALNDPKAAMWSAGVAFNRSNPLPLDKWSVFQTMAEAVTYAESNAVAYPGQVIAVYDADAKTMSAYILQEVTVDEATKLEPVAVGTTPVGDESSIVVAEDGTVSLKGIAGLAFTEKNEEGEDVSIVYQPLMTGAGLTWVRPSATTVEGLATEIEGLNTRLTAVEGVVGKAAEGDAEATGLVKAVADNAAAIAAETTAREEADQTNADAIAAVEDKIGEVAEGKTVVEMISDAQTAATYDDTDVKAGIQTNADGIAAINTKIGTVPEGKDVVTMISDAQAAATYDDTQIKADIKSNADAISLLANGASAEEIDGVNDLIQYVKDHGTEVTGIKANIKTNADDIDALEGRMDSAETAIGTKAAQADLEALQTTVGEMDTAYKAADTTLDGRITELKNDTEDWQNEATIRMDGIDNTTDGLSNEIDGAVERIEALEGIAIHSVDSEFKIEAYDIEEGESGRKLTLTAVDMDKVTGLDDALAGKVDVEDGKSLISDTLISKLEGIAEGAQVNAIDSVDETQFGLDASKKLTLLDIAMGKVTGLQTALDGKADRGTTLAAYGITDAYTKTETEGRIQEVLDGLSDTSETAASVAQALETYKTSNDGRVDTIEGKLAGIAEGAQVNVIEAVKINDTALEIVGKAVNIPVATGTVLGVVMSSAAENKVAVAEDGTMEVNSLNVNKLVQDENTFIILDGGASK